MAVMRRLLDSETGSEHFVIGMNESELDRAAALAVRSPYCNLRLIDRAGIRKLLEDAFHVRRPL
jgi:hypothetical protein